MEEPAAANADSSKTEGNLKAITFDTDKPLPPQNTGAAIDTVPSKQAHQTHEISHPFFYHTNQQFTLSTQPHATHTTTLSLLLFLHVLFLYQWNKRSSRRDVGTNYEQICIKRQFWRVPLALMSFPPVDDGERSNFSRIDSNGDAANNSDDATARYTALRGRIRNTCQFAMAPFLFTKRILHPLLFGHLSGLPLLAYVSHILWQCRALEELYDEYGGVLVLGVPAGEEKRFIGMASRVITVDGMGVPTAPLPENSSSSYLRVLIALVTTSLLLEISLLRTILKRMDRLVDFNGYSTTPRTLLANRAMCSLASLSAAVLALYDSLFPYAPPRVLPFRVGVLDGSGFSIFMCIVILGALSHRVHGTSVLSGLLSGSLWAIGVTSFLGTKYWGNVMIGTWICAILLSLKSNPGGSQCLGLMLPCLDYVAWDEEGDVFDPNATTNLRRRNSSRFGASRVEREDDDLELGQTSYSESNDIVDYSTQQPSATMERRPLLSHATDSTLSNESGVIRGRVPFIDSMDSDLDDGGSIALNGTASRFDGGISRRARGI